MVFTSSAPASKTKPWRPSASSLPTRTLAHVERAFRSLKTVDLHLRPIYHWLAPRVRALEKVELSASRSAVHIGCEGLLEEPECCRRIAGLEVTECEMPIEVAP